MKYLFIINPISGKGKGRVPFKMIRWIDKYCRNSGIEHSIRIWDRPDRINEILREAIEDKFDAVIAAGGDGTINEIGKRLVNTNIALGVIPKGSGNGYARHLGISRKPKLAIQQLVNAKQVPVDAATFGGVPFMNVAGIGIDAEVAKRYSRAKTRGIQTYVRMGIRTFIKFRPLKVKITIDDDRVIEINKLVLIDIANGTEWGGGAKIAPGASISDGWLEAIILEKTSVIRVPNLLRMLFNGKIHKHPAVTVIKGKKFRIERASAGNAHVDGESIKLGKDICCEIQEGSVRLLVPKEQSNF